MTVNLIVLQIDVVPHIHLPNMTNCEGKNDGPSWGSRFETRIGENFNKVMYAIDPDNIQIAVAKAVNKAKGNMRRKSRRVEVRSERERIPEQPNIVRRDHRGSKLPVTRPLTLSQFLLYHLNCNLY